MLRRGRLAPLAVLLTVTVLLTLSEAVPLRAQQWTVEPVVQIGDEQGITFGDIGGMAVTPSGGLFVLDRLESRIHHFSDEGRLIRSFGHRGAGPGELSTGARHLVLTGGNVVVFDMSNQRLSTFDTAGSYIASRPMTMMQGMPAAATSAGDRVVYLARPLPGEMAARLGGLAKHTIFSLDPLNIASADTLLQYDMQSQSEVALGATMSMTVDLGEPRLLLTGDGTGRVLFATTDSFDIRVMNAAGSTTGRVSQPAPRHRYSRDELADIRAESERGVQSAFAAGAAGGRGGADVPKPDINFVMPEFAPAIVSILAGDRFVLVLKARTESQPTGWDVVSYDSKLLGSVRLPQRFNPQVLRGELLYGIARDEYDVETIAVYRIRPPTADAAR